ncbi:MAG: tetratricopeptide repeat protein [Candidatus Sulfotelmatobacter sp.]
MRISSVFYQCVPLILIVSFFTACSRDPNVRKQKYLESGQRYFEKGKFAEAAIEFRNAVGIDPAYADAHYHLALSYLKTQQRLRANEELARTLELQPENYRARVEMAKLLIAGGNLQQAQLQSDLLLKQRPRDAGSHFVAANLLAAQGHLVAAIQEMQNAIALDSNDSDLYLNLALMQLKNGQSEAAETNFKKAIETNPKAIDSRLMLANFYQMRSRFADAEQQLRSAIEIDPQNPELRAAVARLYVAQGRNTEAREYLRQAKRDFPNNSEGYRLLGDFYFSRGEFDKAASEYANLYQEHAKDLVVKKNYVQLLVLTNRLDEARRLNDEILKKNPNDNDALLYSGQIQNRSGHVSEALNVLQQLTKNDPNNALAHYQLGLAFQQSGDQDSAGREWREAVRLRPDLDDAQRSLASLAMRKNDMTTLYETATQMINLQPKSPEGYALRAVSEINRKQFDAADTDVHKAIDVAPQSQFGYVQLGNLEFVRKKYVDAAEAYQDALDRDTGSTDALRGLMNTYIAQKQLDRALAVAEAQISKVPNDGAFYDLLGTALFYNKHDLPAAEAALKRSAELDRKKPDALIELGQVQMAEGRTGQAIDTYRQALQTYPREVSFYLLLGEVYESKQDWSNAGDSYQKALVLTPESPLASGKLAYTMLQSGQNLDVALSLAQTARRGLPTSPAVADTLGWIYYQKGAYSSAIDSLQEAVRLSRESKSPDNPRTHLHLGMAFAKNGQSTLARQQLQIVLRISPNSTDAADAKKQLAQLKS